MDRDRRQHKEYQKTDDFSLHAFTFLFLLILNHSIFRLEIEIILAGERKIVRHERIFYFALKKPGPLGQVFQGKINQRKKSGKILKDLKAPYRAVLIVSNHLYVMFGKLGKHPNCQSIFLFYKISESPGHQKLFRALAPSFLTKELNPRTKCSFC
jgi:hypothetical protein